MHSFRRRDLRGRCPKLGAERRSAGSIRSRRQRRHRRHPLRLVRPRHRSANGSGPIATTATDIASGDLPGTGQSMRQCGRRRRARRPDTSGGADEGRAMAQIVHDLAPGADLAFATAFTGETAFAEQHRRLAKPAAGGRAKVIVDDVSYYEEPFFQEGPVGVAVRGSDGRRRQLFLLGRQQQPDRTAATDIASWEAPEFRDSGGCPPALLALSGNEESKKLEEILGSKPGSGLNPRTASTSTPSPEVDDDTSASQSQKAPPSTWTSSGRNPG